MWEVEFTHEFEDWWETLTVEQQEAIDDRVMLLTEDGPALRRPVVGDVKSSRHANMKELRALERRSAASSLRIRSSPACDSAARRRQSGEWESWYRTAIPEADDLYDTHLQELRDEGLIED